MEGPINISQIEQLARTLPSPRPHLGPTPFPQLHESRPRFVLTGCLFVAYSFVEMRTLVEQIVMLVE